MTASHTLTPLSRARSAWLEDQSAAWLRQGLVDADTRDRILASYEVQSAERRGLLALMLLGALMFGIGVLLLIGYNWDRLPVNGKIAIIMSSVALAFAALGGHLRASTPPGGRDPRLHRRPALRQRHLAHRPGSSHSRQLSGRVHVVGDRRAGLCLAGALARHRRGGRGAGLRLGWSRRRSGCWQAWRLVRRGSGCDDRVGVRAEVPGDARGRRGVLDGVGVLVAGLGAAWRHLCRRGSADGLRLLQLSARGIRRRIRWAAPGRSPASSRSWCSSCRSSSPIFMTTPIAAP